MCFWFFKSKEERDAERMKKEGKRLLRQKQKEEEKARKKKEKEEQKAKKRGEIVEESQPQEEIEPAVEEIVEQEPTEEATEEVAVTEEEVKDKKPRPANYHISLREDGRWQVKRAKGERAIKIFKTQAEAIEFAKMRAESMDGSITIHKKDGKIRKQKY